ncbi:MAG: hypothetical protein KC492_28590 [Myxococcales bacterium]|nr:hypothetical protein [Myxococcales bacterium]
MALATGLLAAAPVGCSEDSPASVEPKTWDSGLAPGCESAFRALLLQIQDAKACNDSSECTFQTGSAPILEHCCSGYYVNKGVDLWSAEDGGASVKTAEQNLASCFDPEGCCLDSTPAPVCWRGKCWPTPNIDYGISQDQCFEASQKDSCAECLCGACPDKLASCLADSGCAQIFACAQDSGCASSYGCRAFAPGFPCSSILESVGGLSGPSGSKFAALDSCRIYSGCFASCGE